MRGWRNTVEIVLLGISTSTKPYPSVFHVDTSKLRSVIRFFEPNNFEEASNRIPPTSHSDREKAVPATTYVLTMLPCAP